MSEKAYIPVGYCPYCKEDMPIQIEKMVHKKRKIELKIGYCLKCEFVLNLEDDFKIFWKTEAELAEMGWKTEKG